jgi:NADPH:quinone reductase-like Zn-dependent oxidoreductase
MSRAVQFDQYGGVEVLHLVEVPEPVPGDQQLLISVKAAGLNPFETKMRTGLMETQFPVDFPARQGTDVAGVVKAVGPGATGLAVGDEILGSTGRRGAQADFALVPTKSVLPRPANVPWEVAGSIWGVGTTASSMVRAAAVATGDIVLVSGASGGVGVVASQLARHRGAAVIGVASERNHEWLSAHGIIPVAYGDGLEDRLKAATEAAGGPINALLDIAGGGYLELAIRLGVAPERIDTIVDFGKAAEFGAKTDGGAVGGTPEMVEIAARVASGQLEVPIQASFPLDQVQAAYTELEHGHPRGKVVLVP